jgi:tetraacyldisaccharide 4'-kinase
MKGWYRPTPSFVACVLWPSSYVYRLLLACRAWTYRLGWRAVYRAPVPVIVVGNLTVGGTGKTPMVLALCAWLQSKGFKPGTVSRGYKAALNKSPHTVPPEGDPFFYGDEPILLARRTGCPTVIGRKRADAVRHLLAHHDVDVVLCDDGFAHFALARDVNILMLDGVRGLGNGCCLPAGPLREPVKALARADMMMVRVQASDADAVSTRHAALEHASVPYASWSFAVDGLYAVAQASTLPLDKVEPLASLCGQTVHAVTGIGQPEAFFALLRSAGLQVVPHVFPDHHRFSFNDIDFEGHVVMTEKDAVKCAGFADARHRFVGVSASLPEALEALLLSAL